ncbi:MAG: redoxin domain-containing protein [Proteobacteria bacterium]|nr:redoxin domain-containing protein [Pseudomonadota bacterium]
MRRPTPSSPPRRLLLVLLALAGLGAGVAAHANEGQDRARTAGASLLGTLAPALELRTIEGRTIRLADYYGHRPVYLKFWATWCVPCREQMPHFERTYEARRGTMAVIAVNAGFNDSEADIRRYREELKLRMPMVRDDGRLAEAFHLRVTPQHVVIGRDGRILYVGHLADAALEAALAAASGPAASAVAHVSPAAAPATAPNLALQLVDGGEAAIAAASGAPTLLAFVSPWCESYLEKSRPERSAECRDARLLLEELHAARPAARLYAVASGLWAGHDDAVEYRDHAHVTVPLALDASGDVFRRFAVQDVPTFVVVDGNGRERARFARRASRASLEAALDR